VAQGAQAPKQTTCFIDDFSINFHDDDDDEAKVEGQGRHGGGKRREQLEWGVIRQRLPADIGRSALWRRRFLDGRRRG
jgi:hypothetical protein